MESRAHTKREVRVIARRAQRKHLAIYVELPPARRAERDRHATTERSREPRAIARRRHDRQQQVRAREPVEPLVVDIKRDGAEQAELSAKTRSFSGTVAGSIAITCCNLSRGTVTTSFDPETTSVTVGVSKATSRPSTAGEPSSSSRTTRPVMARRLASGTSACATVANAKSAHITAGRIPHFHK